MSKSFTSSRKYGALLSSLILSTEHNVLKLKCDLPLWPFCNDYQFKIWEITSLAWKEKRKDDS